MKILILNGPNLNLLGSREPEIYGHKTLSDVISILKNKFTEIEIIDFQSNHEGQLIDRLQKKDFNGCVFNPAAYSHTSIALLDTINAIQLPVIEVHISDISKREEFRRHSMTSKGCIGMISGKGIDGYIIAVESLLKRLDSNAK